MTKILLDYGHGGNDPGAVKGNRRESDDVFRIGRIVRGILLNKGVSVNETRSGDNTVSLQQRTNQSNAGNYDLFVSFHRNSASDWSATGFETYVYAKNKDSKELNLADLIQKRCVALGFVDRGVKSADFHVLRETVAPAILIEMGFICNDRDNSLFDAQINHMAQAIADSILEVSGISNSSQGAQQYHIVVKGDTLYAISRKYGTTVANLQQMNNISNPNLISIGQKVRVS